MTGKRLFLSLLVVLLTLVSIPIAQAQEEVACESDVIVQEGDWLSIIAEQAYGDPMLYQAIAFATNLKAQSDSSYATIDNHDIIEPGWKLCVPSLADAQALVDSAPAAASPTGLTIEQLENATYGGIYDKPVTLTDGSYEGEPFVEGGASVPTVTWVKNGVAYGDLNGDGVDDAAVLLVENSGGTGVFTYVGVQLNVDGQPVDAGTVWVGDRTQVKSMAIENGQLIMEIVTQGPNDPQCCPTLKVRKIYALQDGKPVEVSSEEMGNVSLDDLMGTSWVLETLNFDKQPVLPDTGIIATFADGQVSGSAGCNNYSASVSNESPDGGENNSQTLTVGPVVSTQMACPEPVMNQELKYLTALQGVTQWYYLPGRLALSYQTPQGEFGTLVFMPAPAAEMLTASTWQWVRFTDPVQQFEVDSPENYTLTFLPDGTLQIKADCNQVSASYNASDDGALSIQPGPATMAACPPQSRGDQFVQLLGGAAIYFFEDGNLDIDLMADGGTMEFSP
jgi:heat shock protein HslJ